MKKVMLGHLLFSFLYLNVSFAQDGDSYVIKLHKVIEDKCRVILFSSLDEKKFFLHKFDLKDERAFNDFKNDKTTFFSNQKNIFGYESTLGTGVSDYSYSLENEADIIMKYRRTDENENVSIEEAVLFENIKCD